MRALVEEDCDEAIEAAWSAGMRYFDTAPLYGFGLSEGRLGRILATKPRDDFVVSTKVGRVLYPCDPAEVDSGFFIDVPAVRFEYDYSYDGIMRSLDQSMTRTGLDRFDIVFVHDIDAYNHGGREGAEARTIELIESGGWKALDELRQSGVIKAIGAGVNEWQPCAHLMELADPDIFLLAGRYTLLEQEPLNSFLPKCIERGVGIVIGGPYNSGILAGKDTFNYAQAPEDIVSRVREIEKVCKSHNVPLPQAAIQFVCGHPAVVSVIPGPQTVDETLANVSHLNAQTPPALWRDLLDQGLVHPETPIPKFGSD